MLKEYEFSSTAMGCTVDISLISEEATTAQTMYKEILSLIKVYESVFSRFLASSELSILNHSDTGVYKISDMFREVFSESKELFLATQGYFNPLVQIAKLGYDVPFEKLNTQQSSQKKQNDSSYDTSFERVYLSDDTHIYKKGGHAFDFGGFLKGYVAEKAAQHVRLNVEGVIVNIGGDVYTYGTDADAKEFVFSIYNPVLKKDTRAVPVKNAALATSGNYKRVWERDGVSYHHIVSAETKKNVETDVVSASVIHPQGSVADAYATVALTMSADAAHAFLTEKNCKHVLITESGDEINALQ